MENKLQLLKPRYFGDVINDMFIFTRQNLASLSRAMLLVVLPFAIFGGLFFSQYFSSISSLTSNRTIGSTSSAIGMMGLSILFCFGGLLLANICTQLLVMALFIKYESADAELPQVKDMLNGLKSSIARFIGLIFVLTFLIIAAYFLCGLLGMLVYETAGIAITVIFALGLIVAFFYAAIPLALVPFIYVRERIGIFGAISRAFYLVKGYWWQTFGVIFITQVIVNFAGVIFSIPFYIFYFMSILHSVKGGTPPVFETSIWSSLSGAFMMVGLSLLSVLVYISIAIQYYNLVERKDGESMMHEIENIGSSGTPAI